MIKVLPVKGSTKAKSVKTKGGNLFTALFEKLLSENLKTGSHTHKLPHQLKNTHFSLKGNQPTGFKEQPEKAVKPEGSIGFNGQPERGSKFERKQPQEHLEEVNPEKAFLLSPHLSFEGNSKLKSENVIHVNRKGERKIARMKPGKMERGRVRTELPVRAKPREEFLARKLKGENSKGQKAHQKQSGKIQKSLEGKSAHTQQEKGLRSTGTNPKPFGTNIHAMGTGNGKGSKQSKAGTVKAARPLKLSFRNAPEGKTLKSRSGNILPEKPHREEGKSTTSPAVQTNKRKIGGGERKKTLREETVSGAEEKPNCRAKERRGIQAFPEEKPRTSKRLTKSKRPEQKENPELPRDHRENTKIKAPPKMKEAEQAHKGGLRDQESHPTGSIQTQSRSEQTASGREGERGTSQNGFSHVEGETFEFNLKHERFSISAKVKPTFLNISLDLPQSPSNLLNVGEEIRQILMESGFERFRLRLRSRGKVVYSKVFRRERERVDVRI